MSDHPNITYLKSDAIGKVLATGLAETYRLKPKFPIDFFAKWLLNFSKEQENKKKVRFVLCFPTWFFADFVCYLFYILLLLEDWFLTLVARH